MEAPNTTETPVENTSTPTDDRQKKQIGDFFNLFGPGSDRARPTARESEPADEPTPESSAVDQGEELIGEEIPAPISEGSGDDLTDREGVQGQEEASIPSEEGGDESAVRRELAELKEQFSTLHARLVEQQQQPEPEPEPQPKVEIDPNSLLSDEEIEEFTIDPGKVLRNLAARVYAKAREDTLRDLPQVVEKAAERQTTLAEARSNFWNGNKDLLQKAQSNRGVAQLIRITANEVQSQNPTWDMVKIFEETGKQVRQTLGLAQRARQIEQNSTTKKPNQPRKPRSNSRSIGSEDNRTQEQKQIDEMLDVMG